MAELVFEAIGTRWQIDTDEALPPDVAARVHDRIETFDRTYSRFRSDSLVTRISTAAGSYALPADAGPLLGLYRRLHDATGGAVTPLVGDRLSALGYDATYTLRPATSPAPVPHWDDVMHWDGERLTTTQPLLLDVGAAGKGYLVDLVVGVLLAEGLDHVVVDAGGDLRHHGSPALRIALEHPADPSQAIGVALLADGALCASAPNRRAWGPGLHHVLDGRSGDPTRDVLATWVMASTALVADGVATALFFAETTADAELLARDLDVSYVRMLADGRAERSGGFSGEIFT